MVPKRLAGCQMPSCRGGIHGNPGTRGPPKKAPANLQESAMIRNSKAFDPQRSADNTARVKQ